MSKTVDVHIFSPGTQTSAQGVTREFTVSDLQQVADSYNPGHHDAPIVIGHEMNDKVPSWGWVKNVKLKGEDLYAEVEFTPQMGQFIRDGLYKKVSASFYAPDSKINPDPGQWSLRHVAMLGGQPPAVKGLKGFAYSESDELTLDFAAATGEVKLSPDQVFDEELGPTLKTEESPLEYLKNSIEEARKDMAAEEKAKADAQDLATDEQLASTDEQETEFAEKKMKKKAPAGEQGAEDAEEEVSEEEDTADNKEKMDPVGKEDGDVDNDGDKDSSDEYLKKRRAAIKKSMEKDESKNSEEDTADHGSCNSKEKKYGEKKMKYTEDKEEDTSDNEEYETDEGEGPVASKVKKDAKSGASELDHSEIAVPEGVDAAQWEAGFKDAMDKYYNAAAEGADEVVHEEAEDQTADYLAGIEAGFEFAQVRLNRDLGSSTHDKKATEADEEAEGEGPVASKVKKDKKSGESECCPVGDNNFGETTKKGKDGMKNTEKNDMMEDEDEAKHGEDSDFGRDKVGKGDQPSKRKEKGVGKSHDEVYDGKTSAKAPEEDRAKTGKAPEEDREKVGKGKDVQLPDEKAMKPGSGAAGSGKAVKGPSVSVKYVNHSEQADFSELTARLAELEAANAKLVAEKQAAEARAHRLQLEEFCESLYATGRMTPAVMDQDELVDYMEGLENGTLEFSEGETPATKLQDLLAALPAQVSFSEIAPHNTDEVPEENLDPHERALRMSKEEGMSYAEALKVTLFTVE